jgi:hypothetical protein
MNKTKDVVSMAKKLHTIETKNLHIFGETVRIATVQIATVGIATVRIATVRIETVRIATVRIVTF